MSRLPAISSALLSCLVAAGCASTQDAGIPAAERAMLEAEAKAGMDRQGSTSGPLSVDAMLTNLRSARSGPPAELRFAAGEAEPSSGALQALIAARPKGAAVARIAVGSSSGAAAIDGAALALRRGRSLATALGQPAAALAFDPKLPDDTARIDWQDGATPSG